MIMSSMYLSLNVCLWSTRRLLSFSLFLVSYDKTVMLELITIIKSCFVLNSLVGDI